MGSGKGQDDAPLCVCVHVCLNGNLEHVIQGVLLLSSACVSGTEAGAAIELHEQDKAAVESVCERVKEKMKNKRRASEKPLHYLFLVTLVF